MAFALFVDGVLLAKGNPYPADASGAVGIGPNTTFVDATAPAAEIDYGDLRVDVR